MKKQMIPALVGFWVGHVVTSVLLFGWIMLGILWYLWVPAICGMM